VVEGHVGRVAAGVFGVLDDERLGGQMGLPLAAITTARPTTINPTLLDLRLWFVVLRIDPDRRSHGRPRYRPD
jgi:hypothetical protein